MAGFTVHVILPSGETFTRKICPAPPRTIALVRSMTPVLITLLVILLSGLRIAQDRLEQRAEHVGARSALLVPSVGTSIPSRRISLGQIAIQFVRGIETRPIGPDGSRVGIIGEDDRPLCAQIGVERRRQSPTEDDEFVEIPTPIQAVVVPQVEVLKAQSRRGDPRSECGIEFRNRLDLDPGMG